MKPIKYIKDHIAGSEYSLQERLFRLITLVGLIGLALGIAVGCFSGESLINLIAMAAGFVVLLVIVMIVFRTGKIQIGAIIVSAIALYIVLPFNFLTAGGIYGGGPIWFILGFVLATIVVEGKAKYILLIGGYAVFIVCYCIAYFYPELIGQHTLEMAYIDSLATLTVVTVVTCGMLLFQNSVYREENEMTRRQKKEIEELNRAQNRFFSSMSHEIRTPINTIIGLNEMIMREDVSDEVAQDAQNIRSAGNMLLSLINDILDMSKIESGRMDIVPVSYDVGAMLSDIVNMIWVRAKEKGLEFQVNVGESIPAHLYGDEVRIKQILINLLNNAVKYTSEGAVSLSVQCHRRDNDIMYITYSVSDTGMGIKKENLPHLFNAFRRVDEEKNRYIEGTGLGLSIVKQLVTLMDGDIEVNSVYTKGSDFVVTLPQKTIDDKLLGELDLEKKRKTSKERYRALFEAPNANVLIVDDNDANLMVATKLLKDTKVNIDTASSAAECLKLTEQRRYDVIFMDHLMPVTDGVECLHKIRAQAGGLDKNTPVVALTANAGGENRELYKREGFDGYLLKPVSGAQLEAELLRHLPAELVVYADPSSFKDVVVGPVLSRSRKLPIMITTDSVSDIPAAYAEQYRIAVLPYHVLTEGGDFKDGEEIETDGVLSYLADKNKQVRSEEPSTADYEAFFAEQLTKAHHIVHIAMAKNASKGYEKACEASASFDNVTVVDSGHLSSSMGIIALYAAKYAADGMAIEDILDRIERLKAKTHTTFIMGSTEYLARSKRISPKISAICEACMLHPVIKLAKSSMKVGAVRMGSRGTIWRKYIRSALRSPARIDTRVLFITHAGLKPEELDDIAKRVSELVKFETVVYQKASPAISINCGPDSFGLLYTEK